MRASLGLIIPLLPLIASAQAQEPPPRKLLVEPVLGANVVTLGWNQNAPFLPATQFQP